MNTFIKNINFDAKGLVPAIIQDYKTAKVLTLCYMNKAALAKTLKEKKIYVFRRSKNRVMLKGEISGCVQAVKEVFADCANNSILFKVAQKKAACHKGYFTCYYGKISNSGKITVMGKRIFNPDDVYRKK